MKLLNKKGFILVETLIVTLFVASLFILVYQNLVPSIGEYEKMTSYDDIDSIYASNLFKQNLLRYGNVDYIDSYLSEHTYLDITNCDDSNVYKNSDYCKKIKKSLSILDSDYIFITNYNISEFRQEVKANEFFDSGKLSNFRSYVATIADTDSFYDETNSSNILTGKYRLFMTRTVTNADQTTTLKYVNLGIYDGNYKRYNMGDVVTFAPGPTTGEMTFYVLSNSSSSESTVTLVLDSNISGATSFNTTGAIGIPDSVLNILKDNTNTWTNTNTLTSLDNYVSNSGYTISYDGYQARLLEPDDIYAIFGTKIDEGFFDLNSLFPFLFTDESSNFLSNGLTGMNGYWMANTATGTTDMSWTIQDKKIAPVFITDDTNIGVRPVIVVSKDKLK